MRWHAKANALFDSWPTVTTCSAHKRCGCTKKAMQGAAAYPVLQNWLHFWLIKSVIVSIVSCKHKCCCTCKFMLQLTNAHCTGSWHQQSVFGQTFKQCNSIWLMWWQAYATAQLTLQLKHIVYQSETRVPQQTKLKCMRRKPTCGWRCVATPLAIECWQECLYDCSLPLCTCLTLVKS